MDGVGPPPLLVGSVVEVDSSSAAIINKSKHELQAVCMRPPTCVCVCVCLFDSSLTSNHVIKLLL